ncbi:MULTISPECIES: S-layer family protein [unclassified Nodularia (in: cyanobacteria)]|uniref:two-partner secretion domain-containing protein n=1 Tax=unclassified Nodularia (in: cyanobacteria) TaxID=2656917 RepID=UPI001881F68D|nr:MULTISPECIES: S-layer family protein [unclassified Nodularia (in: cyanobacteria)]MBE9200506.1 S-layer family protein [Nodularia sp. LEGE 06071]MCC2691214.1 S-layer family protein [Nodularia sp. LEGE 04288]
MKVTSGCWGVACGILVGGNLLPAMAQVTSDGTTNTIVNSNGNNFDILNGINQGNNLFHSFSNFSIPTGGSATFDLTNTPNTTTIFSRVTGENISHIDGLIRTLHGSNPVNLFLMNPNGIVFGQNASLNISGSFVGTTANSIKFADGIEFSAINPTETPLLTMSVPVGLQMGSHGGVLAQPAALIEVQGPPANNVFFPTPTLSIGPNQTLALIGGQVDINSANISAPDSRVELWAMQNGTVNIPTSGNWQLASSSLSPTWGNITLSQSSYINTSGANGGAINIQGRGLTLQDGSHIESSTGANGQGQGITVKTTEFIDLLGVSHPANYNPPGLLTSVTGSGATAGNITVETPRLRLANSAWINTFNFGANFVTFAPINNATTGNITIRATDIEIGGDAPFPSPFTGTFVSAAITTLVVGGQQNDTGAITVEAERIRLLDGGRISTDLLGNSFFPTSTTGKAGNITINAGQIALAGGGTISSAIAGSPIAALAGKGTAGNITIQATNIEVSDPIVDPFSNAPSGITVAIGQNSTGQGGNISLTADSLRVFNGGQITSSTDGIGAAGNVNLQVNNITVEGNSQPLTDGRILPSTITAASTTTSDAGSVNLVANRLNVLDHGQISVSNTGGGNAGNLIVNANLIKLKEGSSLLSEVSAGDRGNITLNTDVLLMRYGSKINTNATDTATGGNINIYAPIILGLENSDITANAIKGAGGNIDIQTQGLFGITFRDQLTPESDITASSQFGISGTVQINTVGVDPNSGLVELPANVSDPSQQIATGCADNQGSSFVAIGRGGIPQNPSQQVWSDRTWSDVRDLSTYRTTGNTKAQIPQSSATLVQATDWHRNHQGQVELIATHSSIKVQSPLTCSAMPNHKS